MSVAVESTSEAILTAYAILIDMVQHGSPIAGSTLHKHLAEVDSRWVPPKTALTLSSELVSHASRHAAALARERSDSLEVGITDDDLRLNTLYAGLAFVSARALNEWLRLQDG